VRRRTLHRQSQYYKEGMAGRRDDGKKGRINCRVLCKRRIEVDEHQIKEMGDEKGYH